MDIIKKNAVSYSRIISLFAEYNKKVIKSAKSIYEKTNTVSESIRCVNKYIDVLKKTNIDTIPNIFKIVNAIGLIDSYLNTIQCTLDIEMLDLPTEMSNTYMVNISEEFIKITTEYKILYAKIESDNKKLMHLLLDKIKDIPVDEIHKLYIDNIASISLYSHYIQFKLSMNEDVENILSYLDDAKNVLIGKFKNRSAKCSTSFQRMGLIPVFQHLTPDKILDTVLNMYHQEDINIEKTGGFDSNLLEKISSKFLEKKIGLFVFINITSNPVEYDFKSLIHRKTVEKNSIPLLSGVNKQIIDRFNNIKLITNKKLKPEIEMMKMGFKKADKWVIIRTLNGIAFDIMSSDKNKIFVHKKIIEKIERGSSVRIDSYQKICAEQISKFIKKPQEIILDEEVSLLKNISNKVRLSLINFIEKKLTTVPKNLTELSSHISEKDFYNISSEIVMEPYIDSGIVENREILSTFISDTDRIVHSLVRKIQEGFVQSNITEKLFKEKTSNSLIVHLRRELTSIITKAVEKVLDPRQNIYSKLTIKKRLLKTIL